MWSVFFSANYDNLQYPRFLFYLHRIATEKAKVTFERLYHIIYTLFFHTIWIKKINIPKFWVKQCFLTDNIYWCFWVIFHQQRLQIYLVRSTFHKNTIFNNNPNTSRRIYSMYIKNTVGRLLVLFPKEFSGSKTKWDLV